MLTHLFRLKTNYQLAELVRTPGYILVMRLPRQSHCRALTYSSQWIELAARFAISSFGQMHYSPNSVHYILVRQVYMCDSSTGEGLFVVGDERDWCRPCGHAWLLPCRT